MTFGVCRQVFKAFTRVFLDTQVHASVSDNLAVYSMHWCLEILKVLHVHKQLYQAQTTCNYNNACMLISMKNISHTTFRLKKGSSKTLNKKWQSEYSKFTSLVHHNSTLGDLRCLRPVLPQNVHGYSRLAHIGNRPEFCSTETLTVCWSQVYSEFNLSFASMDFYGHLCESRPSYPPEHVIVSATKAHVFSPS